MNFIKENSEVFEVFKELCQKIQRKKGCGIVRIRSDHGKEFENSKFDEFCTSEGISHEFSSPITPQHNGVVQRKNRTIQECSRVMLHAKKLPYHFWAEAVNNACYILNRVVIRSRTSATLYKLLKGSKPNMKYFHVFGSKCIFWQIVSRGEKWILKVMREFFWDTLQTIEHIEYSTPELR